MTDPLSITTGIAGLLALTGAVVSTCYSYGCVIKDGPAEVQKLVEEIMTLAGVLNAVQALVDRSATSVVPESTPELTHAVDLPPPYSSSDAREHFSQLYEPMKGSRQVLEDVQEALRKADVRNETNRFGRVVKRMQWPLKRDHTLNLLARLERYKGLYVLALDTANISMTMDVQQAVEDIRQTQLVDRLERQMAEQVARQRRVFNWLCSVNCADAHRAARRLHLEGTGSWMLENPAWKSWLRAERSFLWIYGIPGSGKTVMTSTLLEHCEKQGESTSAHLAYFYCDFRIKDSTRPEVLLGGLIAQLCAQSHTPSHELEEFLKAHTWQGDQLTQPTCEELEPLLLALIARTPRAIIVIDGLDECTNRAALLELLTTLATMEGSDVKVLVSSRQEGDIDAALTGFDRLSSRVDAHNTDIEFYVACSMSKSARLRRLAPELRETVRSTLVDNARGMFRWVQCQIEALDRLRTDRDVRQALQQLPQTLYGSYERILERIEKPDREVARRALLWLAYGPRALTVIELTEAVAIEDSTSFRDPEAAWHPQDLLSVIGSLARYSTETDRIELAHHSVKEFLETAPLGGELAYFHLDPAADRAELAQRMLVYLLMNDFQETCGSREAYDTRIKTFPLFHLTARYWPYYARDALEPFPRTLELALQLLQPEPTPKFRSWAEALISQGPNTFNLLEQKGHDNKGAPKGSVIRPTRARWWAAPSHLMPLYYAASFGLTAVVARLVADGADLNLPGGLYKGTALHAAIFRGHTDTVRTLLAAGARIDIHDEHGETAWDMTGFMPLEDEIMDMLRPAKTNLNKVDQWRRIKAGRLASLKEALKKDQRRDERWQEQRNERPQKVENACLVMSARYMQLEGRNEYSEAGDMDTTKR